MSRGRALIWGSAVPGTGSAPEQGRHGESPGPCVQRGLKIKAESQYLHNEPAQNTLSSKAWELGVRVMAAQKDHEHLSCSYCRLTALCCSQKSLYNISFPCHSLGCELQTLLRQS